MNIPLVIDGQTIEVSEGKSVLEAARQLGLDIPALCYHERCGPMNSCLACVVKVQCNGRTSVAPSCGLKVLPGMVVESETAEVHDLRRTALELLLSDHVGDCLAPCHRICPLKLNIPEMLRQVKEGRMEEAASLVRQTMPLASVTGRLCHRPCEQGCRRGTWDNSMAIRDIERLAADAGLESRTSPSVHPASGKTVAIVGGGAAGLAAAWHLTRLGHQCTVLDRHDQPGGKLRSKVTEDELPSAILGGEIQLLRALGVRFEAKTQIADETALTGLAGRYDAVLLAMGDQAKGQACALGLETGPTGLKVDPVTSGCSKPKVFATGSAVRPAAQVTRAISEGLISARSVDAFLRGVPASRPEKPFSSIMGKVEHDEVKVFVRGLGEACPGALSGPSCGQAGGADARAEASRCLHCDCRAVGHCALQRYSQALGADPARFPKQRRRFEQHSHPAHVLFEPGKCILCGICVEIAKQSAEPLGLTFVGRGFDVRVGAPMHDDLSEGLQKAALECVQACPTGAISSLLHPSRHPA